jgi:hypothetical protein
MCNLERLLLPNRAKDYQNLMERKRKLHEEPRGHLKIPTRVQRGSGQSYLNVNFLRRSTQSVSGVYPDLAVVVKIASNDDQAGF